MQLNADIDEVPQLAHDLRGPGNAHHLPAQLAVRGMHRHIQRRQVKAADPVEIGRRQVRHRHEVSVKEGHPVIVVLDIQRIPKSGGHLVHKTKKALVRTGSHPIKHGALEFEPHGFIQGFFNSKTDGFAGGFEHLQFDLLFRQRETQVDQIPHCRAVYPQQPVARLQVGPVGLAVRLNRRNHRACGHLRILLLSGASGVSLNADFPRRQPLRSPSGNHQGME